MLLNRIIKISLYCIGIILFNSFLLATLFHYIFLEGNKWYFINYASNFLDNFGAALFFIFIAVLVYLVFHLNKRQLPVIGGIASLSSSIFISLISFGMAWTVSELLFRAAIFFTGWLAAFILKKTLNYVEQKTNNGV